MAIGNEIIITSDPKGTFVEGIISGTPKPGTVMQLKAATEPVGGRFTYEVFNGAADGERTTPIVLLENVFLGKTAADAYANGDRGRMYIPAIGEELNMLVAAPGTGTGDSIAIGDRFIVNDGDGLLIDTTGDPESEPFQAIETVADVVATGTLVACQYTGY